MVDGVSNISSVRLRPNTVTAKLFQRYVAAATWDHRVLDGAPAAQFLATVRDLLEAPYRLLV